MANQQGWSQQTSAVQSMIRGAIGTPRTASGSSKRRKKKAATAKPAKRSASGKKAKKGKKARLVKGSAAAKAYMAKIRKKRG